eukprot:CAMPEP_0174336332 /NCGR_PEP_ID=MMETSP0810-20121108/21479_1 /TAXON_ID=73025 ORGANISM="Eutreptiella gymnastica-like, Strain CCMP1594" /NCGR_SAMPLE_ID=MMETSP0810 /ASSEMBLY_ACC=CAM_ASM_000659 /LENGTH=44 /DNA_ID= /DNA_START= /DNA_END= /DNA_ORIENTATION=
MPHVGEWSSVEGLFAGSPGLGASAVTQDMTGDDERQGVHTRAIN